MVWYRSESQIRARVRESPLSVPSASACEGVRGIGTRFTSTDGDTSRMTRGDVKMRNAAELACWG